MIFLSFPSEDSKLALTLALGMRAAGADVWCSLFKDELDDGRPWRDQVYAALDRCSVFVLLVTGSPIDGMTKEESDYALDRYNQQENPRVVAVRSAANVKLPPAYRRFQAVDLPANWAGSDSQFFPKKLAVWGEVATPATPPTSIPSAAPAALQQALTPTLAPTGRDAPPAARPRTVEAGSAPPSESAPASAAAGGATKRVLGGVARTRLRWRNGLAVLLGLALTAWGVLELFGVGDHTRASVAETDDRGSIQAPVLDIPDPARPSSESLPTMVRIPASELQRGYSWIVGGVVAQPISEFKLAETEVTRGAWREVMGSDPGGAAWSSDRSDDRLPASSLTWDEARSFCVKLSDREGLTGDDRYRLPSEAEWEYACRAGTTTQYWSGDSEKDLARVGWYDANSGGRVHAVREKAENTLGLFDMHGNVSEWCEDTWHSNYEGIPTDGRARLDGASPDRVIRGGSFESSAGNARSAFRDGLHRSSRRDHVGFRPAMSVTTD